MKKNVMLSAAFIAGLIAMPLTHADAFSKLVDDINTTVSTFNALKTNAAKYQATAKDVKKEKLVRAAAIINFLTEGINFTNKFMVVAADLADVLNSLGLSVVANPIRDPINKASNIVDQINQGALVLKSILPKE